MAMTRAARRKRHAWALAGTLVLAGAIGYLALHGEHAAPPPAPAPPAATASPATAPPASATTPTSGTSGTTGAASTGTTSTSTASTATGPAVEAARCPVRFEEGAAAAGLAFRNVAGHSEHFWLPEI